VTVRERTIRAASTLVSRTGLLRPLIALSGRVRRPPGFGILTFHRVNDDRDPFFTSLSTSVFSARMRHIARHYTVLPVVELVERARRGALPPNALALTFDDGYQDSLTHAAPILAQYGLPTTIFLATGLIGTSEMAWYDRLATALKHTARPVVELAPGQPLPLETLPQRLAALQTALTRLKRVPDSERERALERLVTYLGPEPAEARKRLMLSWDEADALRGLGFSFGAHTVRHPVLSRLEAGAARDEIHGSRVAIERALGVPVHAFAYPNGGREDYTATTVRLVEEAGFTAAVTTRRGVNTLATPVFELRRGGPWEQHLPTYALKLAYYHLTGV
jgi:peptidoglycan/xylan/chitin deacetylase (PgdA/CDA1 family)